MNECRTFTVKHIVYNPNITMRFTHSFYTQEVLAKVTGRFHFAIYFEGTRCYVSDCGDIKVFCCVTNMEVKSYKLDNVYIADMLATAGGGNLYVATRQGLFFCIDLLTDNIQSVPIPLSTSFHYFSCITTGESGNIFVSCDDRVVLYKTGTWEYVSVTHFPDRISAIVYNTKHKTLLGVSPLYGQWMGYVFFGNVEHNHVTSVKIHDNSVMSLALLNEDNIVSCSFDKTVRICDIRSRSCIRTLRGHTSWVRSVAVAPDQHHIVSVSDDKTVRVWGDNDTCIQIMNWHKTPMHQIILSGNGKYAAVRFDNMFVIFELCPVFTRPVIHGTVSISRPRFYGSVSLDENGNIRQVRKDLRDKGLTVWRVAPSDVVRVSETSPNCVTLSRKRHLEAIENTELNMASTTDAIAWSESIRAVQHQWTLSQEETVDRTHLVTRYRFDTLQLINRMNGGKGLVSEKTVPMTVLELIGYYIFEE